MLDFKQSRPLDSFTALCSQQDQIVSAFVVSPAKNGHHQITETPKPEVSRSWFCSPPSLKFFSDILVSAAGCSSTVSTSISFHRHFGTIVTSHSVRELACCPVSISLLPGRFSCPDLVLDPGCPLPYQLSSHDSTVLLTDRKSQDPSCALGLHLMWVSATLPD